MIENNREKGVNPSKKAQAAMEFLMTYGWAVVVVLLTVGTLAYFNNGITGKSTSDVCIVSAGFGCPEFKINTNAITMIVINGLGKDIQPGAIVQVTDSSGTSCSSSNPTLWKDGEAITFTIPCSVSAKKKFKGNIQIIYIAVSSSLSRTISGTLGGVPLNSAISMSPLISNVQFQYSATTATITWNTNIGSSSLVRYGTTSGVYTSTASGANGVTIHSVQLSGLNLNTLYYYVVNSSDGIGNTSQSTQNSFKTVTCADTDDHDGGYPTIHEDEQGTATAAGSGTDICTSATQLTEYYCDSPTNIMVSSQSFTCSYGCSNGACNPSPSSPYFAISNIQVTDGFYCDLESPPVTFTVTNTGTAAGVPAITYSILNNVYNLALTPTPSSIASGNSVNFALNMDYDWQGGTIWQATITTNPGETKISNMYGCQPS